MLLVETRGINVLFPDGYLLLGWAKK